MTCPCRIVWVQKNTVTIDEEGIPNTVSVDRVIHEPSITDQTQHASTSAQTKLNFTKDGSTSDVCDNYTDKDEHVVDRIVRHIDNGDNHRYVVRQYNYGPKDDTMSQSTIYNNILPNAIGGASIK